MRKETDLRQVKAIARALLMLDIGKTDFSPMIVKHPFTDSGITAIPKPDGGVQMLNIMDDPSDLKRWRDFMCQTIEKASSAYEVYMMVTKPYGLTFLKFVYPHLSQADMSGILASAWTRAEALNQDVNVKQSKLLSMFKAADLSSLMDEEESGTVSGAGGYGDRLPWRYLLQRRQCQGTVLDAESGNRRVVCLPVRRGRHRLRSTDQ